MKKRNTLQRASKITMATLTTAGILLTGGAPSFAEQEQTTPQQKVDNLQDAEANQQTGQTKQHATQQNINTSNNTKAQKSEQNLIQNGSFEEPIITPGNPIPGFINYGTAQVTNNNMSHWTNLSDTRMEVWRGTPTDEYFKDMSEGHQIVELNGYEAGELYQEINVASGAILNWSFGHASRTQIQEGIDVLFTSADGSKVYNKQAVSTDSKIGTIHQGTFQVPSGVTKLRFVLKSTEFTSKSVGNLIDNVKVLDVSPQLVKPKINQPTNKDKIITGTAEPNANITLQTNYLENGIQATYTGKANRDGAYEVEINQPAQAGTKIAVKQSLEGKKDSEYEVVTVEAGLEAPTLQPVSSTDTVVTGTGTPNTKAIAKIGGATFTGNVNGTGNLHIDIEDPYPAGTEITVYLENDKGQKSAERVVKIQQAAVGAPTLDTYALGNVNITGKVATGTNHLLISVNGGTAVRRGAVTGTTFTMNVSGLSPQLKGGDKVTIIPVDAQGRRGTPAEMTVAAPSVGAPTLHDVKEGDVNLTGAVATGTRSLRLSVNNGPAQTRGVVNADGTFVMNISGLATKLKANDKVKVIPVDANGGTGTPAELTVKPSGAESGIGAPTVDSFKEGSANITGKVATGTMKLRISVNNGPAQTRGVVNADGTFMMNVSGLTPKLKAGDKVKIIPVDEQNGTGTVAEITVQGADSESGIGAPTLNVLQEGSANLTGKVATGTVKLRIAVNNGTAQTRGVVEADGTFMMNVSGLTPKLKAGDKVKVIPVDEHGGTGVAAETTVQAGSAKANLEGKQVNPGGAQANPEGKQVNPGGTQANPEEKQVNPGGAQANPEGKQVNPGGTQANPEEKQVNPGGTQANPEEKQVNPGGTQANPEGKQVNPGGAQANPEESDLK